MIQPWQQGTIRHKTMTTHLQEAFRLKKDFEEVKGKWTSTKKQP